jgi:hypothetical protein
MQRWVQQLVTNNTVQKMTRNSKKNLSVLFSIPVDHDGIFITIILVLIIRLVGLCPKSTKVQETITIIYFAN